MRRSLRSTPEPIEVNVTLVLGAGTALWFVAFMVLLPLHGRMVDDGRGDWLWTALAGWALGLLGIAIHKLQIRAAHRQRQPDKGVDDPNP